LNIERIRDFLLLTGLGESAGGVLEAQLSGLFSYQMWFRLVGVFCY